MCRLYSEEALKCWIYYYLIGNIVKCYNLNERFVGNQIRCKCSICSHSISPKLEPIWPKKQNYLYSFKKYKK